MADELHRLKLAFLPGTGRMGRALARAHAKAGFRVIIGSRSTEKAVAAATQIRDELGVIENDLHGADMASAAAAGDIIFWVPGPGQPRDASFLDQRARLLRSLQGELRGKIIVDVTNIFYALDSSHWGRTSSVLLNQEALGVPARWTCAWKHVFWTLLEDESLCDPADPSSVMVNGDDHEAVALVMRIVDEIPGFRGLNAGSLDHSRISELIGPLWLTDLESLNFPGVKYRCCWRYGPPRRAAAAEPAATGQGGAGGGAEPGPLRE